MKYGKPILSAMQVRLVDSATIESERILSTDLMARAAESAASYIIHNVAPTKSILILCGPGNNGGDGYALAKIISEERYNIKIIDCSFGKEPSLDNAFYRRQLNDTIDIFRLENQNDLDHLEIFADIIVDAIFGSGLNKIPDNRYSELFEKANAAQAEIIAIDIPSGCYMDNHTEHLSICAHTTLSFALPKLAFLFPENAKRIGNWMILPIGLNTTAISEQNRNQYLTTQESAAKLLRQGSKFDHKGKFGHIALVVGSVGKMGAAVLAAKSAHRSGSGLVSVQIPDVGQTIMQIASPETMISDISGAKYIQEINRNVKAKAYGIGCGLGQQETTAKALLAFIDYQKKPLVLDADALNILAKDKESLSALPSDSILTPHLKEFERLFGKTENDFERYELQKKMSKELNLVILLKGAHSCITTPAGQSYFNNSGNVGLATAGSGDVLTGIITSLVGQGYSSVNATVLGCYIHGLAADQAVLSGIHPTGLIASDIIDYLPKAYNVLHKIKRT